MQSRAGLQLCYAEHKVEALAEAGHAPEQGIENVGDAGSNPASGARVTSPSTEYQLRPWEHGPADECPICARCPVLAVRDADWSEALYGCLICGYMVDKVQLAQLVLIRRELGTPNRLPK